MTEPRKGPRQRGNDSPIATARIAAGMTQGQLAEKIGCAQKDVSAWERGKRMPRTNKLIKISKALGCPMDYLISGE